HARLSIIDLSERAVQPMQNEAGDVHLVFNGEIYDFAELRTRLIGRGHTFHSNTDSEVIVHGYEDHGISVAEHVDGMFAFAVWDETRQRLVLSRDRPGKKPVYWALHQGRLYFGSEIKALFAMGVPREEDEVALPALLVSGYVPAPRTLYRGVHQLPPGHTLVWRSGQGDPEVFPFWQVRFHEERMEARDAQAELREAVTAAVRRRLVSDVPLGAFLSGGIDSTLIVGLMAQGATQPVRTFSLGFEGDPGDETPFARLAAQAFGTKHTEFVVKPDAVDLLPKLVHLHDGPFGDSTAVPNYIVSQLAREHVTVVLTGDGGDELFAGYQRFVGGVLTERIPRPVAQGVGRALEHLPLPRDGQGLAARGARLLVRASQSLAERALLWNAFFPENDGLLVDHQGLADEYAAARQWHFDRFDPAATPLAQLLQHNYEGYLAYDLLPKTDRTSMAHGLEARSPLLDTRLTELAARLPAELQIALPKGDTKHLLKETFRDLLPEQIRKRGKRGFGMPLHHWFRTDLKDFVADHLLADGARCHRFLDRGKVKALVEDHNAGRAKNDPKLWLLLTVELWLRS
ncbi:MAG: asparagine synthase (glutamine-hydrolyzing), partial [Myxococcales bacterium]|nr:asparagine synthase (glutamine-hydrolyzing) [Myxococcales bacterium]